MHINVMLKYTIHVKYIYNTNIDFYINKTVKSIDLYIIIMNQKVLHNKILNCMANFNCIIDLIYF